MRAHVAVLDPAAKTAELDTFNQLARRSPLSLTYHLPGIFGMDSVRRSEEGMLGMIILGSSTSVHDALPWQRELSAWLLPKMKAGVPTFGICYGHQLIAHLFGGKVGFVTPNKDKLQGFRQVSVDPAAIWNALPRSGSLFVSHRETVKEAPREFRAVMKSPEIALDGLAHESLPIYTTQAHPEATEGLLHNLGYVGPSGDLSYGHAVVDAFLAYVASKS
jgi:GMP synthase-like glutamine amidotransferase